MAFSLIPVLDVQDGLAVHAIAGYRAAYRPVNSRLVNGSCPLDLARAYGEQLGLGSIYLADLDAIGGKPGHLNLWQSLAAEGFSILLDCGLRERRQIERLVTMPEVTLVVGLETICGPEESQAILDAVGPNRVIFSLDQFEGRPLTASLGRWNTGGTVAIAEQVVQLGFESILLLDLARVGTGRGSGSVELFRTLKTQFPRLKILTGGGVSSIDDVRSLAAQGFEAVLVGSALHDGGISREDIKNVMRQSS